VILDAAESKVKCLANEIERLGDNPNFSMKLPAKEFADQAVTALKEALAQYPMDPGPGNPDPKRYKDLDRLQSDLLGYLDLTKDTAYRGWQGAEAQWRERFAPTDIRATRIGNSRAAIERYPYVAYSADFSFLWPRLRMVLPKDPTASSAVDTASAQLDFAVLMTVLSACTAVIWMVLLACFGRSYLLYFAVGIVLPGLVVFFYTLVDETQKAFGEVMVMAIDGLRLELLRTLHQPLPTSLTAEQKTWERLQLALYSGPGDEIRYRYPKT
jgi:hypothetical protein